MSIKNFIPEIWASRLLTPFEKALVYASCCNRDYEGDIKNLGDTVKIPGIGPITVSAYSGSVAYQELEDEQSILKIDQRDYFGFSVDDADALQTGVTFMSKSMQNAAYSVRDKIDQYIAAMMVAQAASVTDQIAVNSLNIIAVILSVAQALDELNVPEEGRFMVIPSWFEKKLVIAKIIVESTTNDALDNGVVGKGLGFTFKKSNNVPITGGTNYKIVAGTTDGASYAGQIDPARIEALRDKDAFNDYIRGEVLYGGKVLKPDALAVLDATVAAEP